MLYRNQNEYQNQMENSLMFLDYAHQVATSINKSFFNVNAHADAENKGRVIIFADDYTKRVSVPYSYFTPIHSVSYKEQVQGCLNVINKKAYETNKIQRVLK